MTGTEGKFALEALDPALLFRLLVYAPGHVPRFSDDYVDPQLGEAKLDLEARDLDRLPPERVLRGRVVDAHGDPIAHAVLEPKGKKMGRGGRFGALRDVDTLSMSDEKGEFALACSKPDETLLLFVSARAFAAQMTPWITAGGERETITLDRGVTVTGVVQKDGQPLGGVELGFKQQDPAAETYVGDRTVGTTSDGRFTFVNVPANDACFLYGLVASFKAHGSLSSRPVKTGAPETTVDVGVLALEPGLRFAGHIQLSGGTLMPSGAKLLLGRESAWDAPVAEVGEDGSFAFDGLPAELYSLTSMVPGYAVSSKNGSFDFLNGPGLLGRLEGDERDVVLLLEPDAEPFELPAPDKGVFERYEALKKAPLRGLAREARAEARAR